MEAISILTNNKSSWFHEYNQKFKSKLENLGYVVNILTDNEELKQGGEICFFLACTQIVPAKYLQYHKHNLVIHHSDLPEGRGSSPLVWQILEGKNEITFTLFEAADEVDTGDIYSQSVLELTGYELLNEIFFKRWNLEQKMILEFLNKYPNVSAKKQSGPPTFYRRRNFADDIIDIEKPIKNYINNFRISDNEKWPLNFEYLDQVYYLKIYRKKEDFMEYLMTRVFQDIALRPIDIADSKFIQEIKNSNDVSLFNFSEFDFSHTSNRTRNFVIFLHKTKVQIGVMQVLNVEHRHGNCEVGIFILNDYKDKDYELKAYKMVLDFIFENFKMHMVYMKLLADDAEAKMISEQLGFRKTGYLSDFLYHQGRHWNCNLMCVTKSEFYGAQTFK